MNRIIITGRLVRDPEKRETSNGSRVASFSVAVPRTYTPKGKEREADFINCKAFNHNADFLEKYFSKGSPIELEGTLETRKYTDAEGNNRIATEVIVSSLFFVPTTAKEKKDEYEEIPF